LMRYKDSPEPSTPDCPTPPGEKVMHANLKIGDAIVLASDGRAGGKPQFEGFALSLTVASAADAKRYYDALMPGGEVVMPLGKTFFSPSFGMVNDKFGVCWMVYVAPTM